MNVRLKLDTRDTGPEPGAPVIIGAGMMGDRVSIVFASLRDLNSLVEEACGCALLPRTDLRKDPSNASTDGNPRPAAPAARPGPGSRSGQDREALQEPQM